MNKENITNFESGLSIPGTEFDICDLTSSQPITERHFPDGRPEIPKTLWPLLNSTKIRTLSYQKVDFTPPSVQNLFLKIMIFSTFFKFCDPGFVSNGRQ